MSDLGELRGRMGGAASAFLEALPAGLRARAQWPFDAPGYDGEPERMRWYYTPNERAGVALADLDSGQQRLAHMLLATGLSAGGYVTAATIIGLENVLDMVEGFPGRGWMGREQHVRNRDPLMYYVAVFGEPGGGGPWQWQFGGHHVAVQYTVVGDDVSGAPLFFGADPARAPQVGDAALRPLGAEEDLARALVTSLEPAQAQKAVVSPVAPPDLVLGNRSRVKQGALPLTVAELVAGAGVAEATIEGLRERDRRRAEGSATQQSHLDAVRYSTLPKGLRVTGLRAPQQDQLRRLLGQYVERLPAPLAAQEWAQIDARWEEHAFLWAGGAWPGDPHYYRVQGPRLVVEYDNTQRGANHAHSVWRDAEGDFGVDLLAAHRAAAGQGG